MLLTLWESFVLGKYERIRIPSYVKTHMCGYEMFPTDQWVLVPLVPSSSLFWKLKFERYNKVKHYCLSLMKILINFCSAGCGIRDGINRDLESICSVINRDDDVSTFIVCRSRTETGLVLLFWDLLNSSTARRHQIPWGQSPSTIV